MKLKLFALLMVAMFSFAGFTNAKPVTVKNHTTTVVSENRASANAHWGWRRHHGHCGHACRHARRHERRHWRWHHKRSCCSHGHHCYRHKHYRHHNVIRG